MPDIEVTQDEWDLFTETVDGVIDEWDKCEAIAEEWGLPIESVEHVGDRCYLVHHEGGYLSFWYCAGEEAAFHFSLLCEVGQPFQPCYDRALGMYPNRVVELEKSPWLIHKKLEE